jgi:nucleotide-binding universal stress UspA family protein
MLTIDRILHPTDLSEGARRAFAYAASLAHWHDAELHMLNVAGRHQYNFEELRDSYPLDADILNTWVQDAGISQFTADDLAIVQVQEEGAAPGTNILSYADENTADLIVMGTHGRRGVDRMLLGSVAEEVVRQAPCPVCTVRNALETAPSDAVRRVMVPIDFSDASKRALEHARELALTYGAEIVAMHAIEEVVLPMAYGMAPKQVDAEAVRPNVEAALANLLAEHVGVEHARAEIRVGYPPQEILDAITDESIDWVVMGTHGRQGLNRLLMGSVAERIVRHASCPVLTLQENSRSILPASA